VLPRQAHGGGFAKFTVRPRTYEQYTKIIENKLGKKFLID